MDEDERMRQRLTAVLPHLNERQRRLLLAAEAQTLGRGGLTRVARATGVSRPTISRGLADLAQPSPSDRVRRIGGGRKRRRDTDPTLVADLDALVDLATRGDPMSPL